MYIYSQKKYFKEILQKENCSIRVFWEWEIRSLSYILKGLESAIRWKSQEKRVNNRVTETWEQLAVMSVFTIYIWISKVRVWLGCFIYECRCKNIDPKDFSPGSWLVTDTVYLVFLLKCNILDSEILFCFSTSCRAACGMFWRVSRKATKKIGFTNSQMKKTLLKLLVTGCSERTAFLR